MAACVIGMDLSLGAGVPACIHVLFRDALLRFVFGWQCRIASLSIRGGRSGAPCTCDLFAIAIHSYDIVGYDVDEAVPCLDLSAPPLQGPRTVTCNAFFAQWQVECSVDSAMGKQKQVRKFGAVKRLLNPNDTRLYVFYLLTPGNQIRKRLSPTPKRPTKRRSMSSSPPHPCSSSTTRRWGRLTACSWIPTLSTLACRTRSS